ncbi:hypothetical protein F4818DRAFT_408057 [Hypoxylon cercidicola]|nr:hypothetical protein F4818DRAFT_408057 [Hypoxylon cercidicola]
MTDAGIGHVGIVIANAGISPPVVPLETVDMGEIPGAFNANALGPLALYQACHPLIQKSSDAKFITISSAAGSISAMEAYNSHVALNWITL